MHKSYRKTFLVMISILITIVILLSNTMYLFYDNNFFESQSTINPLDDNIKDASEIDKDIRQYLTSSKSYMENTFLNEKERTHMKDVRRLFSATKTIVFLCLAFLIYIAYIYNKENKKKMKKDYIFVSKITFLIILLLIISAVLLQNRFDSIFIGFHKLLFTNDLWLMGANDKVTLLYPETYFMNTAKTIFLRTITMGFCIYLLGLYLQLKEHSKNKDKKKKSNTNQTTTK